MNRMNHWILAGLLGMAAPLWLQAAEDEHADHADHETEAGETLEEHEKGTLRLTDEQQAMAGIMVETLQPHAVAGELRAPGEIQLNAYATSRVAPRIAAQVIERQVRLGDSVETGAPLVTLSSVEMAQAQGNLLVAEREWQRVSKLGREVVAEQRYTEARIAREQARARVSAFGMTDDEIKQLVDTGKAELANGRFRLLAPQAGTVIRDEFIVGELVDPGHVLFEISDESLLWVEARLTPDEAARVAVDARQPYWSVISGWRAGCARSIMHWMRPPAPWVCVSKYRIQKTTCIRDCLSRCVLQVAEKNWSWQFRRRLSCAARTATGRCSSSMNPANSNPGRSRCLAYQPVRLLSKA